MVEAIGNCLQVNNRQPQVRIIRDGLMLQVKADHVQNKLQQGTLIMGGD